MGQCNFCGCPKEEEEESGQINFPFLNNLFTARKSNTFDFISTSNLNLFQNTSPNQELSALEHIKLSNQEKKRFETMVRNSNISRERLDITSIKEESMISISNRLFINEIKEIPKKKYITQKLIGVGNYEKE